MKNTKETRQAFALGITLFYVGVGFTGNWVDPGGILVFSLFPLFFILFSEKAADYVGLVAVTGRITRITKTSTPEAVELVGWIILFIPVIVYFLT